MFPRDFYRGAICGTVAAILAAVWFLTTPKPSRIVKLPRRCTYSFPWTGRCLRMDGHTGEHY